jgi:hypothetical protein
MGGEGKITRGTHGVLGNTWYGASKEQAGSKQIMSFTLVFYPVCFLPISTSKSLAPSRVKLFCILKKHSESIDLIYFSSGKNRVEMPIYAF